MAEEKKPYKRSYEKHYVTVDEQRAHRKKYPHKKMTLLQLANGLYRSKYNRNMDYPVAANEDVNNSAAHRLYAKDDVVELVKMLGYYLDYALIAEDIETLCLTDNIIIERYAVKPRVRKATGVDVMFNNSLTKGQYYMSNGRYKFKMKLRNALLLEMQEFWQSCQECADLKAEQGKILEQKLKEQEKSEENDSIEGGNE